MQKNVKGISSEETVEDEVFERIDEDPEIVRQYLSSLLAVPTGKNSRHIQLSRDDEE